MNLHWVDIPVPVLYFALTPGIGNTMTVITLLIASVFFKSNVTDFSNLTVRAQSKTPPV
jgi:hypothetical protein